MASICGKELSLEEYLKLKTRKVGDCLEFTNKPNAQGYASLAPQSFLARKYGQKLLHRIVWKSHFGEIPLNHCVMHKCDNRICVNINHLRAGTWADNNKDRAAKGRSGDSRGEKQPQAKLNNKKVLLIRELEGEFSATFLAEFFNLHYSTIYYIWRRRLWPHI